MLELIGYNQVQISELLKSYATVIAITYASIFEIILNKKNPYQLR